MRATMIASVLSSILVGQCARGAGPTVVFWGEKRRNNLVAELLEVSSISKPGHSFTFTRPGAGWIFIAATCQGDGTVNINLDKAPSGDAVVIRDAGGGKLVEAVRHVAGGEHQIRVECPGEGRVDKLVVKSIPE